MGLLAQLGLPPRGTAGPVMPTPALESKPKPKPKPRRQRNDAELRELAKWPGQAHRVWKRLDSSERMALTVHMANRYGQRFAKDFVGFTGGGAKDLWSTFGGPFPEIKPEKLQRDGYVLIQKDSANQWWGHANGHVMVGQFGVAGVRRAAEIADQQAFDAALAKLTEAARRVLSRERAVLGLQNLMDLGSASDADRPGEFAEYQTRLEAFESAAQEVLDQALALRDRYVPKRVDLSALDPVITELTRQRDEALFWMRADQLDRWKPVSSPANLPPAGGDPIDFSKPAP